MTLPAYSVFSARGIELEWMIVDRDTLEPLPIADRVLQTEGGLPIGDVRRGMLGWSNEMALHVLEVKNLDPRQTLEKLAPAFQREVRYLNRMLEHFNARLMPTAMHPWMDPTTAKVWPHGQADIYSAYTRIFRCGTHGWANLQSMHLNLPFANDDQFARLHAAIRLALPLLPALAASSPVADGAPAPALDFRMVAYAHNADEIPSIAGDIIPDTAASTDEYRQRILEPMYRDIAPHDPQRLLQREWLNSRGAIPRFDRGAIEIRVIDAQENPIADLAIAAAVTGFVRRLYFSGTPLAMQQAIATHSLATIFEFCVRDAEHALIENEEFLVLIGYTGTSCSAGTLLEWLIDEVLKADPVPPRLALTMREIIGHGPLARRILNALDGDFSRERLTAVWRTLCDCLDSGRLFRSDLTREKSV